MKWFDFQNCSSFHGKGAHLYQVFYQTFHISKKKTKKERNNTYKAKFGFAFFFPEEEGKDWWHLLF